MHMWHHVTNHLIISTDKDSNSENRIKLRVRDTLISCLIFISPFLIIYYLSILVEVLLRLLTYRGDLVLLYLVSKHHS
jgi:hypothetical protein